MCLLGSEVMHIHSFHAMKTAQKFIQDYTKYNNNNNTEDDNRLIFCGNFNINSSSNQYKNIISGKYNNEILLPMKSVYMEYNGDEPKTCHCYTLRSNEYFTDTSDYIFYCGDIKISPQ